MGNFMVEEKKPSYGAKIKVVGVGGGGGNMINHIIREKGDEMDIDLQLGEKITKGLGAGMNPDVGTKAAQESYEEIKSTLEYSDIVFIASGLGGGTGTGAAPVVAQAAKEIGALTISVVTMPFDFEGKKRYNLALKGLNELKKESDSIVVIPNQRLKSLIDKKAGIKESFKIVDNVLARAVSGMCTIVLDSGNSDINSDFADVKKVMEHRGMALLGIGESEGEGAAQEAIKNAIQSPLLSDITINGAVGVLVHFKYHPYSPFSDIEEAMCLVQNAVDDDADIIFGTTSDESFENNKIQVTIIATGFRDKEEERPTPVASTPDAAFKKSRNPILDERISRLKVSGGYNSEEATNMLETPSYIRNQMD